MSPKISSVVLEDVEDEDEAEEQEAEAEAEVSIASVLLHRTPAFTDVTSDRRTPVPDDAVTAAAAAGGRSSCSRIEDETTGAEADSVSGLSMSAIVESLLTSPDVKLMVSVQLEEESR